jgi:hypothetical protein
MQQIQIKALFCPAQIPTMAGSKKQFFLASVDDEVVGAFQEVRDGFKWSGPEIRQNRVIVYCAIFHNEVLARGCIPTLDSKLFFNVGLPVIGI